MRIQVEVEVEVVGIVVRRRHAANFNFRATPRPITSASLGGTAFPNCRIVSDQEPWKTKSSAKVCSRALSRTVK